MNKVRLLKLLYVGLLLILTACQAAGQPLSTSMFKPGNMIDGMILTTGAQDAAPLWEFCSPAQFSSNATTADCDVPMLPKLAIGHFLLPGDEPLTRLDWSEISWKLTIDDQPIDLQSFSTYDFVLPARSHDLSPIRKVFVKFTAWDVVLTNLVPGEHTLHGSAQMGTDTYDWVIHLTIRGNDLGTGSLWVGPKMQETF